MSGLTYSRTDSGLLVAETTSPGDERAVARALKDHDRAVIVGQRSYGKGSVQSIFALRTAPAGLKLTTAKFYSPKNKPYSEQGVEPDVLVRIDAKPARDGDGAAQDDRAKAEELLGDPERDLALRLAIEQAKRRLNAAR